MDNYSYNQYMDNYSYNQCMDNNNNQSYETSNYQNRNDYGPSSQRWCSDYSEFRYRQDRGRQYEQSLQNKHAKTHGHNGRPQYPYKCEEFSNHSPMCPPNKQDNIGLRYSNYVQDIRRGLEHTLGLLYHH